MPPVPPYPIHARPSKDPSRLDSPASEGFSHKIKLNSKPTVVPCRSTPVPSPKPPLPTPTYFPNAHSLYLSPLSTRLRIMHSSKTGPSVTSPAFGVPHTFLTEHWAWFSRSLEPGGRKLHHVPLSPRQTACSRAHDMHTINYVLSHLRAASHLLLNANEQTKKVAKVLLRERVLREEINRLFQKKPTPVSMHKEKWETLEHIQSRNKPQFNLEASNLSTCHP